jgi:peptide/nickel transport system permease protein
MRRLILLRVLAAVPMLFGISIVGFLLMKLVPGDPSSYLLGPFAGPDAREALLESLGWDQPWPVQYVKWLGLFVQGDFGTSVRFQTPVSEIVGKAAKNSGILVALSFGISMLFGFFGGVLAAIKRFSILDRSTTTAAIVLASAPVYWLGLVLVWFFSLKLDLLPVSGMHSIGSEGEILDLLEHAVLPAITASLIPMAVIFRLTRSEMAHTLDQPYIQAARARGLSERSVVFRHATRNIVSPIANVSGLQLGFIFTATLFVEVVFSWPGVGYLIFQAISARDIPVIQTVILFTGLVFVIINLVSDLIRAGVDRQTIESTNV